MTDDNIVQFPLIHRDAIDAEQWRQLQGEFYLDCFLAHHGRTPGNPEELRQWLQEVRLFAEMDNPFFRGWLVRRLSEPAA